MRISDWSSDVCSSDLAHCAPPATAAFHFRVITRVVPSAIIGIIGGRRRIAGAMALDRAFIATLVTAAVGRFIGAVPGAGPAPLGVIGATHGAIVDFARYAVGLAGVDARIGIGYRQSVVSGKSVSVGVDIGGRRIIRKQNTPRTQ